VYLYAGEQNEAKCDEHIPCITEAERLAVVGQDHYVNASFDYSRPHWRKFNDNVINGIKARAQPHDFICVIAGVAHKQIADAFPNMLTVEFGIGYGGTFSKFRVWESYAWMHTCYGASKPNPHDVDGQWFDEVIPNSFEVSSFPVGNGLGDYYLFMGRLTERKGCSIAADVCRTIGAKLMIAGHGTPPDYGTHVGVVGPEDRADLMRHAKAIFVPTTYLEPFGGVAVEAMMCGTPAITTDWGAFTETVEHGVTGYRCRTKAEFVKAALDAPKLDRKRIRNYAVERYSTDTIALKYQVYFERLSTLWGDGWYAK
jgi:glycosyltransferase involved in cell wall biosynthesis